MNPVNEDPTPRDGEVDDDLDNESIDEGDLPDESTMLADQATQQSSHHDIPESGRPETPSSKSRPNVSSLLPSPAEMDVDEYEAVIMDAYINAKARGICRRSVLDHYFGNDKIGMHT